ncbi:ScpA family protein [uncultured Ruminococcus sp.]|uniref:segregation and condensation protein A n=1 Tax=uncultured Ruminococcus sp. TaxID=165186 RepID=UPI00262B3B58|nr:segregation/condensation protein A [uncultured Ruminococcus sp.]
MSAAQFKLDMFEGPLDLLLHLISKHKLNIYDIEISLLLEQYMDYINDLDHEDYEDAADFLEMAARLIYIKTCSLLPHDEESKELKKELEGRIIEYSLCKQAALTLRDDYVGDLVFVRAAVKLPVNKTYTREHDPQCLYDAYMGISKKARNSVPLKAKMFEPIVSHKIVSVTSKIIHVLKRLYKHGECDMGDLYDGMTEKSEKVATFLAILELTKSGRIFLNDDNSKIFFNRASKNKKVESDFDKPVVIENETAEEVTAEPEPIENILNDEPTENVQEEYEEDTEPEVTVQPKRHAAAKAERISNEVVAAYAPIKSAREVMAEMEKISEKIDSVTVHTETVATKVENEPEPIDEAALEEIRLLEQLADITPDTVFKPNYWAKRRYYWGYSPVGDDGGNNYWRYG